MNEIFTQIARDHFIGPRAVSERMKYFLLVGFVAGLVIYTYGTISFQNPEYSQWELHDYRVMAQASPGVTEAVRQPFVYRLLGPYIAGLLPFSIDNSFRILSISLGLFLFLLFYAYLSRIGVEPPVAALTTILFVLNKYLYGFPIWNYFQIDDLLSLIEIILLMWAMKTRKWILFGMILFAGSLTKETTLIMIPISFVYLLDEHTFEKEWKYVFGAVLPACFTTIALR